MIKLISTKNFRGHTRTFEFGPGFNELIGPNESGKSTVNEAISFVLFGYDSNGTKNPDHLITIGQDHVEAAITTDKATFTRKKKRGATSKIVLSRSGAPDTELKNMDDVIRLFGAEFDTFASAYNAGYFMRLPEPRKLEVLGAIVKIDRKALFEELGGPTAGLPPYVKFEDPRKEAGYVANDRRKIQNSLEGHKGRITQLTQERAILTGKEVNVEELQKEVSRLEARAALLTAYDTASAQYSRSVAEVDRAKAENKRVAAERERIELELKSMPAARDVKSIQGDMNGLGDKIAELKSKKRTLPTEPRPVTSPNAGTSCPACGQMVSEKAAKSITDGYNAAVVAYNTECRAILDENKALDDKIANLSKQHIDMFTAMQQEIERSSTRSKLEGRLAGLIVKALDETGVVPPTLPSTGHSRQECERMITEMRGRIYTTNGSKERVKEIDTLGVNLDAERQKMEADIDILSIIETTLAEMPGKEAERKIQSLQIANHQINVRDGEFVVSDANNCPYQSLSSGRKMKFDIEMCKKVQGFLPKRPNFYFIDNEDLIDDVTPWLPEGAQIFVARVDAAATDLQIVKH